MSESHFWVGLRYVEANPCRAGIVQNPADYPWSSAAAHLSEGLERSRILDMEFWRKAGGKAAWIDLHARELRPEQLQDLRRCTYAGRPFGEESFIEELEARFQRKWPRSAKTASVIAA